MYSSSMLNFLMHLTRRF